MKIDKPYCTMLIMDKSGKPYSVLKINSKNKETIHADSPFFH